MQISALPSKFPVVWGASASPSYIRAIPVGSQIGITGGAASLTDGFPPLNFLPVGSGGVPPFGQDMNGILRQITQWSQWQNAGGLVQYDSVFSAAIGGYPFGALLAGTTAGVVWLSTIDNNTSNPDSGGAHWTNIGASSSPIMVGTDTGSANVVTANVLPAPSAYVDGQLYIIQKVATPNNGSMTGNIQGLGSHPVVNLDGTALTANQWPASGTGMLEYNLATTSFRLLNPVATVAANAGLATTAQQVLSLNIPSLPSPTGALSLSDSIPQHVVSDNADREVTLSQVAATIGTKLGQSLTTNGYQVLPGGLIIQWGTNAVPTTETGFSITYPIAFPTAMFSFTSTIENPTSDATCDVAVQVVTKGRTTISLFLQDYSAQTPHGMTNCEWIAVGF